MVNIILIDKTGEIKECKFKNFVKDDLFKKCGLKKNDNLNMHKKWINNKSKFNFYKLEVWGKDVGRANTENKYDFPPPIDNTLFFGTWAIIAYNKEDEPINLSQEELNSKYNELLADFQSALIKGTKEGIERASLSAQVEGLQAQVTTLQAQLTAQQDIVKSLQQQAEIQATVTEQVVESKEKEIEAAQQTSLLGIVEDMTFYRQADDCTGWSVRAIGPTKRWNQAVDFSRLM